MTRQAKATVLSFMCGSNPVYLSSFHVPEFSNFKVYMDRFKLAKQSWEWESRV